MLTDELFAKLNDISMLFLDLACESDTDLTSDEQKAFDEMSETILDILADHRN